MHDDNQRLRAQILICKLEAERGTQTANNTGLLTHESSTLHDTPPLTKLYLLILPKQFHQQLPTIHLYDPIWVSLIQTTTK